MTKDLEKISESKAATLVAYSGANISLYGNRDNPEAILNHQDKIYWKEGDHYYRVHKKEFSEKMKKILK